jgi:hypothetical protein
MKSLLIFLITMLVSTTSFGSCYILDGTKRDYNAAFGPFYNFLAHPIINDKHCEVLSGLHELTTATENSVGDNILILQLMHGGSDGVAQANGGNIRPKAIMNVFKSLLSRRNRITYISQSCYSGSVIEQMKKDENLSAEMPKNLCAYGLSLPNAATRDEGLSDFVKLKSNHPFSAANLFAFIGGYGTYNGNLTDALREAARKRPSRIHLETPVLRYDDFEFDAENGSTDACMINF